MAWRWDSAASSSRRTCSPASATDWRASRGRRRPAGPRPGPGPERPRRGRRTPRRAGAGTRTRAARRAPSRRRPAARPASAARRPPAGRAAAAGRRRCRRAAHRARGHPRGRFGIRMWVDRLHSVHRVLSRRPRPPQASHLPARVPAEHTARRAWGQRRGHTGRPYAGATPARQPARSVGRAKGAAACTRSVESSPVEGRSGQRRDDPGARPRPRRGAGRRCRPAASATPTCTTARAASTTTSRSCSGTRPPGSWRPSGTTYATWPPATS